MRPVIAMGRFYWAAVELCPDLQSPDIDVPCSRPGLAGVGASGGLPFTGLYLAELILLVLVLLAIGGLLVWSARR